jgi:hypothetical protein
VIKLKELLTEGGSGDCYSANGRLMIGKDDSYKLVHGIGILQTDGKPFGHCWVEKGSRCIDQSNNQDTLGAVGFKTTEINYENISHR